MQEIITQIREQQDGTFAVFAGSNADGLSEVGRESNLAKARAYARWWAQSLGATQINHGLVPLVPLQGTIQSH